MGQGRVVAALCALQRLDTSAVLVARLFITAGAAGAVDREGGPLAAGSGGANRGVGGGAWAAQSTSRGADYGVAESRGS